jgi:hypothetical protein
MDESPSSRVYHGTHAHEAEHTQRFVTNRQNSSAASAQHRKDNPEKAKLARRKDRLWTLYRLTPEDYQTVLNHQGGICAITGKVSYRNLDVDHDHTTGLIRGLLSPWANKGLSFFSDDPALLRAAADYLENPPAVAAIGPRYGLLGRAQRKKKMIYGGSN